MTPIKEHKCEKLFESKCELVYFYDSGWAFIPDSWEPEYIYDMEYCPFCGKRLE